MAQKEGFSHITVSTDEEDDFVIHAGAVADVPNGTHQCLHEGADEHGAAGTEVDAGSDYARGNEPVYEHVVRNDRESAASSGRERTDASGRDDDYRPTTLEDINESKMPLAQKIVIVFAVVVIIAFAVRYVVF